MKQFQVDTGGTLTTGLVSYYPLNDATDFYGSNNLTNTGSCAFTTGQGGNGAVVIDSSGKWLTRATDNMGWSGDASVSFWIKPIADVGSSEFTLFHWSKTTGGNGFYLGYQFNGGTRRLSAVWDPSVTGSYNVTFGTSYQHIAVVLSGTSLKFYLNGVERISLTTSGTGSQTNQFSIGSYFGNSDNGTSNMHISGFGVWTKALSTTEIDDLYNGGSGQTMTEDVNADVVSCTFSIPAPTVQADQVLTVSALSIISSLQAPTVQIPQVLSVSVQQLTLSLLSPTLSGIMTEHTSKYTSRSSSYTSKYTLRGTS